MAFFTITSAAPTDWIYGEGTPFFFYLDNTGKLKTSFSKSGTNSFGQRNITWSIFSYMGTKNPPFDPESSNTD